MAIRVNRDVLYFGDINKKSLQSLPIKRDAPPHKRSQNRGYPCPLFARGVLTVEAAFCGTAFFLALFSLVFLFQILQKQNQIQSCLTQAARQYETYGTKGGSITGLLQEKIVIHWDEDVCYTNQTFDVPYLGGNIFRINTYQQVCINPYDGKSMVSQEEKAAEYVYIAENGQVYHKNENCVYLNPGIQSVSFGEVSQKRNTSGGKYYACHSCCKKLKEEDDKTVYITPYGSSFHSQKNCPGLKRTIRKVALSSIGDMPACSKCGK